jgi:hypothetical protein
MSNKFSRFLNLERARGDRPKIEEPSRLQTGGRFEALAQRGEALHEAAVPETHLERFRGEAPLTLEEEPAGELRFPRCGSCQSENGRFAKECTVCGADLTTPQQREYNERLWQSRQAQDRELAAAAGAAQLQTQEQMEAERREDQLRYVRKLQELRQQEEKEQQPMGWTLLHLIPFPPLRWAIVAGLVALPCAIALMGGTRSARGVAAVVGLFIVALLLPRSKASRWGRNE